MEYKIKKNHIFLFLVIVISFALISYSSHKEDVRKKALPPTLLYHLDCQSDKIDYAILTLDKNTSLIGAYVEFSSLDHNEATQKVLDDGDIFLNPASQLFEISPKLYARIPTESLCDLVTLDTVKYVSIPMDKSK